MTEEREYIDLSHQLNYNAEQLREALINLRTMIRDLALEASSSMNVADYESRQLVLNWLIEDIELRD